MTMTRSCNAGAAALMAILCMAGAAAALSAPDKCESSKLNEAGKYGFCRLKAEAKAVKTGLPPDYSKCDGKYGTKWPAIEAAGDGTCPSTGDQAGIQAFITKHSDDLTVALDGGPLPGCGVPKTGQLFSFGTGSDGDLENGAARSITDNGDGTITDNLTRLMWEKKSNDGTIHDQDNTYTWGQTSIPHAMNGTMVTTFLAALNGGGGFAGYTDWRIPNVNELQSLVNYHSIGRAVVLGFSSGCVASCTVTACSCTQPSGYWSSSTYATEHSGAFYVDFFDGTVSVDLKSANYEVRAVRGGS